MATKSTETGLELNGYCKSKKDLLYPSGHPESAVWQEAKKLIIAGNCDSTVDFVQDQIRKAINAALLAQKDAVALIHSDEPTEKELDRVYERLNGAVELLQYARDCFDLDTLIDLLEGESL